jgi:hypothetical protein
MRASSGIEQASVKIEFKQTPHSIRFSIVFATYPAKKATEAFFRKFIIGKTCPHIFTLGWNYIIQHFQGEYSDLIN